jgi:hypothetical protein
MSDNGGVTQTPDDIGPAAGAHTASESHDQPRVTLAGTFEDEKPLWAERFAPDSPSDPDLPIWMNKKYAVVAAGISGVLVIIIVIALLLFANGSTTAASSDRAKGPVDAGTLAPEDTRPWCAYFAESPLRARDLYETFPDVNASELRDMYSQLFTVTVVGDKQYVMYSEQVQSEQLIYLRSAFCSSYKPKLKPPKRLPCMYILKKDEGVKALFRAYPLLLSTDAGGWDLLDANSGIMKVEKKEGTDYLFISTEVQPDTLFVIPGEYCSVRASDIGAMSLRRITRVPKASSTPTVNATTVPTATLAH